MLNLYNYQQPDIIQPYILKLMYPAYHVTIKKIYLFALTSHNCDKVSAIHKYVSSYHVLLCPVSSLMGALDSYLTY